MWNRFASLRSAGIAALWIALIIGQLYVVVEREEAWPLSNYPMYADKQGPNVSAVQVEGVRSDGSAYAVSIRKELVPLDPSRLLGLVRRLARGKQKSENERAVARALLDLYEEGRRAGRHAGPPLEALSVYETTWRIVPDASNRDRPAKRRLVASTGARQGS
jgi:hypothetical protein